MRPKPCEDNRTDKSQQYEALSLLVHNCKQSAGSPLLRLPRASRTSSLTAEDQPPTMHGLRLALRMLLGGSLLLLLAHRAAVVAMIPGQLQPHPPGSSTPVLVSGVELWDPALGPAYAAAQLTYYRTVLSKPAVTAALLASTTDEVVVCPRVPDDIADLENPDKGSHEPGPEPSIPPTYLVTASVNGPPAARTCTNIPSGSRVIISVFGGFEWYAPPVDYSSVWAGVITPPLPARVRLSPDSLLSLAQAAVQRVDPSVCLTASINGSEVPGLYRFLHATPAVTDMNITASFFSVVSQVMRRSLPPEAQRLLQSGINHTDFAAAGYFLVLPFGFPDGTHTLEFGVAQDCSASTVMRPKSWWAKGTDEGSKDCWPDPTSCMGDIMPLAAAGPPQMLWRYTLHVQEAVGGV